MSSTASTKERALNSASTSTTALRRVSDDPLLRPFLSSLFDSQTYVKTIIRDGKSEECLVAISDCTGKVNEEIQRYIVQHKVSLFVQLLLSQMKVSAMFSGHFDFWRTRCFQSC